MFPEYPVLVLERETGRLVLLGSPDDLRCFVDEFRDILDDDFALWDGQCRRLHVPAAFGAGSEELEIGRTDRSGVRQVIEHYSSSAERDDRLRDQIRTAFLSSGVDPDR